MQLATLGFFFKALIKPSSSVIGVFSYFINEIKNLWCLNENSPHMLIYLNILFPVHEVFRNDLRGVALLEGCSLVGVGVSLRV